MLAGMSGVDRSRETHLARIEKSTLDYLGSNLFNINIWENNCWIISATSRCKKVSHHLLGQ